MKKISIIIPCYNCEKTLTEAVESCYTQGFSDEEFEVILVDDCSKDNTRSVMEIVAKTHKNIKTYFHDANRGGGATRNTATEKASANLVFCLDSDDILTPNMLTKMVRMQEKTGADGIAVETSIKFRGTDVSDVAFTNVFGYRNEIIPLISLLQYDNVMCPLYSTFLYTKKAFVVIGGYPTDHGFDTQGFAWRFLAKGLVAYTCPDTTYLHRINFHESYYLKEYNAGRTNINWKKILIEQNSILSDEAYDLILKFDESNFEQNIIDELKKLPNVFVTNTISRNINLSEMADTNAVPRNSFRGYGYRTSSRMRKVIVGVKTAMSSYITIIKNYIHSGEPIYALFAWHVMQFKKWLKIDFNPNHKRTNDEVDLYLTTIAKDFDTLQLTITSAKKNILHTIGNIYIVTQINDSMKNFCELNGYILVDETTILGYGKDKINYKAGGFDRSGWMLQQLLKLGANKIVKNENFISICTDTILLRPISFIENGAYIFRQNDEWHEPYFVAFKKIFGYPTKTWFSYTSHMMMFNKKMLEEMQSELEAKHNKPWSEVYAGTASPEEISCISDYETYANWMLCNYPEKVKNAVLYNRTVNRSQLADLETLERNFGKKYHTVSFHAYAS